MELNKEQALRLWNAQIGKRSRATDYAGRQMDKAAYNQRGSEFGWNVDHIYPQCKGGKTADYNLICCNIHTNDEKADRFPCFKANGRTFTIKRRQNHYEIFPASQQEISHEENFFDAGQIIDFWENKDQRQEYQFIGYVKICLTAPEELAASDIEKFSLFLKKLYHTAAVFKTKQEWETLTCKGNYIFTVIAFDMPLKEDTQNLLDECKLLNTVGQDYLNPKFGCELRIYCGMKSYPTESEISWQLIKQDIQNIMKRDCKSLDINSQYYLAIHGLVWKNTSAYKEIQESQYQRNSYMSFVDDGEGFFPYDKKFPEIEKILKKQFKR